MYQNKIILYQNSQFRQFVTLGAIGILFEYKLQNCKTKN